MNTHFQLNPDLYLIKQTLSKSKNQKKRVNVSINHIFVIDCSGSMWGELSKIRRDLYNKISTIMKPNDSISVIWFSGRGEYGVILEDYSLNSGTSLNKVRELIDKWLTPRGLTAFKEPFEEVKNIIKRVFENKPQSMHSLFFLTDGYDNQYSTGEIIKAVSDVKEDVSASTIVEYGWYCNRELLGKIATEIGGIHIFSEHFQDYEPYLEKEFKNSITSKRKYINVEGKADFNFVFKITEDGNVINYNVDENGQVLINESDDNDDSIYYLSKKPLGNKLIKKQTFELLNEYFVTNPHVPAVKDDILRPLYAAMFSFSRINNYNMVSEILKYVGDAKLIKQKANTFGAQKISELEAEFLAALKRPELRFVEGYNPNLEPKADAYCVLDLIDDLMSSEENKWFPTHEAFNYKRIGRKTVAEHQIAENDKEELNKLVQAGKVNALKEKIEEVSKEEESNAVKFEYDNKDAGHPVSNLVWNEKRANLSVQVRYPGYINLPNNEYDKLPNKFETQIFRNYTLIKDGVIHSYKLPVSLNLVTFNKLQSKGLLANEIYEPNKIYVLDFSKIPVINRKMIETMSAEELFKNEYELLKLKAKNKVFNYYKKIKIGTKSIDFAELYGEEAASYLKTLGIAPYGFNPPLTLEKSQEEILVNSLQVKIDKLSLISSKKDFDKALKKYKDGEELSNRELLFLPGIKEFEKFMESMDGIEDESLIQKWLDKKSELFRKKKNKLMNKISKTKFLCIIGKTWFKEFESREDNEMELELDGRIIKFTVVDKMEKIKL